jgi:hypothetical protein
MPRKENSSCIDRISCVFPTEIGPVTKIIFLIAGPFRLLKRVPPLNRELLNPLLNADQYARKKHFSLAYPNQRFRRYIFEPDDSPSAAHPM